MEVLIRPALLNEATHIAPLVYEAIGDIALRLTGERTSQNVLSVLEQLIMRTDNRHTYQNTHVAMEGERVLGILVLYDGVKGAKLDVQLQKWLQQKKAPSIKIDVEAHSDEYYIDTICTHASARGLGIGTKLLTYAEELARAKGYKKLALNVELEKDLARRLYERMGFVITEPWTIINEPYHHMVKQLDL